MHEIEPHYNWRNFYQAEEDPNSPFFNREYSEFYFTNKIYNHLIHPQWDEFGSSTLFIKILYIHYQKSFCIIELFGEWNDCLHNDIMYLKRNILEHINGNDIQNFIFIGENLLNFHAGDTDYYEELNEEIDGFNYLINTRNHVYDEFMQYGIGDYFIMGGKFNEINWRTQHPIAFFEALQKNNLLL